jgi:hypothetical protein
MMARLKIALQLARLHVWAILLMLYPFADQMLATIEGWMPSLAPYLGANAFRFMGVVIVGAKFALQVLALARSIKAAQAKGQGNG